MSWMENWPTALMWASILLFVGALFAIARFLRNASDPRDDALDWPAAEDLEKTDADRRRSSEGFISLGLVAFVVATAVSCVAFAHRPDRDRALPSNGILWTPQVLLRDSFPTSERVTHQKIPLTQEEQAQLAALSGVRR
jgi:hypothetical protein